MDKLRVLNVDALKRLLANCKSMMENDGIEIDDSYYPVNTDGEVVGGIFDLESLPIEEYCDGEYVINEALIDNVIEYDYDIHELAINGLYDVITNKYSDTLVLTDLTSCDSLDLFDLALDNVIRINNEMADPETDSEDDFSFLENELNDTLENLDPIVDNYWEIIVFLIDNGAVYLKQVVDVEDGVNVYYEPDISRTNLAYRLALEYTAQI